MAEALMATVLVADHGKGLLYATFVPASNSARAGCRIADWGRG
jgi:hypothetical protein